MTLVPNCSCGGLRRYGESGNSRFHNFRLFNTYFSSPLISIFSLVQPIYSSSISFPSSSSPSFLSLIHLLAVLHHLSFPLSYFLISFLSSVSSTYIRLSLHSFPIFRNFLLRSTFLHLVTPFHLDSLFPIFLHFLALNPFISFNFYLFNVLSSKMAFLTIWADTPEAGENPAAHGAICPAV